MRTRQSRPRLSVEPLNNRLHAPHRSAHPNNGPCFAKCPPCPSGPPYQPFPHVLAILYYSNRNLAPSVNPGEIRRKREYPCQGVGVLGRSSPILERHIRAPCRPTEMCFSFIPGFLPLASTKLCEANARPSPLKGVLTTRPEFRREKS